MLTALSNDVQSAALVDDAARPNTDSGIFVALPSRITVFHRTHWSSDCSSAGTLAKSICGGAPLICGDVIATLLSLYVAPAQGKKPESCHRSHGVRIFLSKNVGIDSPKIERRFRVRWFAFPMWFANYVLDLIDRRAIVTGKPIPGHIEPLAFLISAMSSAEK